MKASAMHASRFSAFALICFWACLPPPGSPAGDASSSGDQTSVPLTDIGSGLNQTTSGASGAQTFSAARGSMTVSAASAPDLCLTVTAPSSTNSALVLRTCDASVAQRFVLVSGKMQSSNGNCVQVTPSSDSKRGDVSVVACDPNNMFQRVVFNGGTLGVGTAGENLMLQSDRTPASTQSIVAFAAYTTKTINQQWTLGQASHDNQQALVTNGTHIVLLEEIGTCVTGSLNAISFKPCSPANGTQSFTFTSDGLMQVGKQCVSLRTPSPLLVACDPNQSDQHVGVSSGILFTGTGQCIGRSATDPNQSISQPCDFDKPPHFVVGLSQ